MINDYIIEFDDDIERLMLQNSHELSSPAITFILGCIDTDNDFINRFAKALQVSTYINELTIQLALSLRDLDDYRYNDTSIMALAEAIEKSSHLNIFKLDFASYYKRIPDQPIRLPILSAVAKNKSIHSVSFESNYGGESFLSWTELQIIVSSESVQNLSFFFMKLADYSNSKSLHDTSCAFSKNKSLKKLSFEAHLNTDLDYDPGYAAIMIAAKNNSSITTLQCEDSIQGTLGPVIINALSQMFGSLQNKVSDLLLGRFTFDKVSFSPVAALIKKTKRISMIRFQQCLFSEASDHLFKECFCGESQGEGVSLVFEDSELNFPPISSQILQYLANGPGRLTALDLSAWNNSCLEKVVKNEFQAFTDALTNRHCNLNQLIVPDLSGVKRKIFYNVIPRLRNLQHLELISNSALSVKRKKQLLSAMCNNSSITTLRLPGLNLQQEEEASFHSITERNQILSRELQGRTIGMGSTNSKLLPFLFRASAIATIAVGPHQIFAFLTSHRDENICHPDYQYNDDNDSNKKQRIS